MQAQRLLEERLGAGWTVRRLDEPRRASGGPKPDAVLGLTAPDGSTALQLVKAKQRAFPRDVIAQLRALPSLPPNSQRLYVAPFLGPRARRLLEEAGVNCINLTGNMLVQVPRPSLFARQQGAAKDPAPATASMRSLRGGKAARVVRTLCDYFSLKLGQADLE